MAMDTDAPDLTGDGRNQFTERAVRLIFLLCAGLTVATTVGIVVLLGVQAVTFFARPEPTVVGFLTGTEWHPTIQPHSYGVLPLVAGTIAITLGSAVVALPIGLLTAIYISEYASDRARAWLKPALEVLAGVPTVVYGYFALVYITPALSVIVPSIETFNALSASIVVGIMIIPMVASISEDAMSAVPDSLRNASYGLGATKFEVSTTVVVPAAVSGIVSSFILAISRAIGETMAVTLAAGRNARMVNFLNPTEYLSSIEPITAAMVQLGTGDIPSQSTAYKSLFALGLTLFVITFTMNIVSELVAERYREVYE